MAQLSCPVILYYTNKLPRENQTTIIINTILHQITAKNLLKKHNFQVHSKNLKYTQIKFLLIVVILKAQKLGSESRDFHILPVFLSSN